MHFTPGFGTPPYQRISLKSFFVLESLVLGIESNLVATDLLNRLLSYLFLARVVQTGNLLNLGTFNELLELSEGALVTESMFAVQLNSNCV